MPRFSAPTVCLVVALAVGGCSPFVTGSPSATPEALASEAPSAGATSAATVRPSSRPSTRPRPSPCTSEPVGAPPTAEVPVVAIPLGCEAGATAVGGGSVWIVPHLERTMLQVDPATNTVVGRISLGDRGPGAEIAASDEMVWASVSSPGYDLERLVHVDPASGTVVAFVDVAAAFPKIAGGSVWATGPGGVHRVDPVTNTVTATIDLHECGLVTDGERVWCVGATDAVLIDDKTNQPRPLASAERLGWVVAYAGGLIWGISDEDLWALDPETGRISARLAPPAGIRTWSLDAVGLDDSLWVAASSTVDDPFEFANDRLVRVDLSTLTADCVLPIPNPEHGLAGGDDTVWLPVIRSPWLLRLEPSC